jgi:hypothetical protein
MFDTYEQVAAQAATNVSRRQCLGLLGRTAFAAAAAAGGLLAHQQSALAGRKKARCCYYRCGGRGGTSGRYVCRTDGSACPALRGCTLRSQSQVSSCNRCGSD